jgi:hypothetical protein
MSTEQKSEIAKVVSDGMDKMYAEGFEMAKLRVQNYLLERVQWLKKEAHQGGDFKHLIARADESTYIAKVVSEMTPPPL